MGVIDPFLRSDPRSGGKSPTQAQRETILTAYRRSQLTQHPTRVTSLFVPAATTVSGVCVVARLSSPVLVAESLSENLIWRSLSQKVKVKMRPF